VLDQIKVLSADTMKQIYLEDKLISKFCYKIIKMVDPNVKEDDVVNDLKLDLKVPATNYFVGNSSY
jgi:hypothetical protein